MKGQGRGPKYFSKYTQSPVVWLHREFHQVPLNVIEQHAGIKCDLYRLFEPWPPRASPGPGLWWALEALPLPLVLGQWQGAAGRAELGYKRGGIFSKYSPIQTSSLLFSLFPSLKVGCFTSLLLSAVTFPDRTKLRGAVYFPLVLPGPYGREGALLPPLTYYLFQWNGAGKKKTCLEEGIGVSKKFPIWSL